MTTASHQTVRLSQGKHRGPDHGVCVMELASMLAGEPFSDRPRCVDPVIAGFLRTYNDGLDERRRQDLYGMASEVVGTRSTAEVQGTRARMCLTWAQTLHDERRRRGARRLLPARAPAPDARLGDDAAGTLAGRFAVARSGRRHGEEAHAQALAFIADLIAAGVAEPDRAGSAGAVPVSP